MNKSITKKSLYSLMGVVLLLMSCSKAQSDYAIVHGFIADKQNDSITISGGVAASKMVYVDDNGTFTDTVKVGDVHNFKLIHNKKMAEIHLKNGYKTTVQLKFGEEVDFKNIKSLILETNFSGDGAEINRYLNEKLKLKLGNLGTRNKINQANTLDEKLKIINQMETQHKELLTKFNIKDPSFLKMENADLFYQSLSYLHMASNGIKENLYEYITPQQQDSLDNFKVNNAFLYANSGGYYSFVKQYVNNAMDKIRGEREGLTIKTLDSFFATIQVDQVKNDVITNEYKKLIDPLKNNNAKAWYTYLAGKTTDKDFKATMKTFYETRTILGKGTPAPKFTNFENHAGGTASLDDFKGKYVYIDVWATWCGPCKMEIPFLQEIEKQYHGKNIAFVSISIDDGRGFKGNTNEEKFNNAREGWIKMVNDKNLGGVQLLADKGWKSDFAVAYNISSIPRFLLIDPDGNIVSADAPRPSDTELVALFDTLGI